MFYLSRPSIAIFTSILLAFTSVGQGVLPVQAVTVTESGGSDCAIEVDNSTDVLVTKVGNDCVVQFKRVGTTNWTVPDSVTSVRYLIVGGGGGGAAPGAGGAGGLLTATSLTVTPGESHDFVVGAGGLGKSANQGTAASGGGSSAFGLTAIGGGGGASLDTDAGSGGSGGSRSATGGTAAGGAGTPGQGNSGGTGGDGGPYVAGGGGGSGGAGANSTTSKAGNGGPGRNENITGVTIGYAGGGGGSWYQNSTPGQGIATHGGGNGGIYVDGSKTGTSGTANTGGGGGGGQGSGASGGNGGSGVVIIRFLAAPKLPQDALSVTSSSGTFGTPLTLTTTEGPNISTGALTFTISGGDATGCSVSSEGVVTSTSAGTCLVTATRAGDSTYASITSAQATITFAKASRTLTFVSTALSISYGNKDTVLATSSPGPEDGTVTYSASAGSTACTVNSSTREVTVTRASGICEITAEITGGANYLDATAIAPVIVTTGARPLTVEASGATVDFGTSFSTNRFVTGLFIPDAVSGATYIYEGTGSTSYGPSTTKPTNAGTYKVTPSAATFSTGLIENYAITYEHGNIQIRRVSRTLSFGGTTSATVSYGNTRTVTATPSAGDGDITYSTASEGCTVIASTGVVTATSSTGTCTISASIAEGTNHLTAATGSSFTVTLAKKNITLKTADLNVTEGGDVEPATEVSVGSLVGSDAISSATFTYQGTGTTSYGPTTVAPTDIGTYDVTPSVPVFGTGSAANYTISFAAGTLTISAQPPAPSSGAVAAQPVAGTAIAGVTARGSDNGKGSFLRVRLDKTPAAFEQLTVVVRLLDLKGELVEELRIPVSQGASMVEIPIDRAMGRFNAVAQISSSTATNAATNASAKLRPDPLQHSTIREATEERPARLLGKRLSPPVLFAAESAKLTPAIKRELRKAARAAKESGSRLAVTGFHSLSGQGEAFEQSLAEKRALRVARYLRNRGLDNWILYHGLSSQDGEQFRGQPRRVEIRVLKR